MTVLRSKIIQIWRDTTGDRDDTDRMLRTFRTLYWELQDSDPPKARELKEAMLRELGPT